MHRPLIACVYIRRESKFRGANGVTSARHEMKQGIGRKDKVEKFEGGTRRCCKTKNSNNFIGKRANFETSPNNGTNN